MKTFGEILYQIIKDQSGSDFFVEENQEIVIMQNWKKICENIKKDSFKEILLRCKVDGVYEETIFLNGLNPTERIFLQMQEKECLKEIKESIESYLTTKGTIEIKKIKFQNKL